MEIIYYPSMCPPWKQDPKPRGNKTSPSPLPPQTLAKRFLLDSPPASLRHPQTCFYPCGFSPSLTGATKGDRQSSSTESRASLSLSRESLFWLARQGWLLPGAALRGREQVRASPQAGTALPRRPLHAGALSLRAPAGRPGSAGHLRPRRGQPARGRGRHRGRGASCLLLPMRAECRHLPASCSSLRPAVLPSRRPARSSSGSPRRGPPRPARDAAGGTRLARSPPCRAPTGVSLPVTPGQRGQRLA